nr:hypothetical protein [Tanacetum cinerariifolium]
MEKDCRVAHRMVNPMNARNPTAAPGAYYECGAIDHFKAACPRMQSPYGKQSRTGLKATRNQRRCRRPFSSRIMKTLLHQVNKDWIKPMIAWNKIALIMRNKSDLDTFNMDDLYNNLKVYESEIKGQSSSSLNSQNVAFVSSDNTSSTNETVNTAHSVYAASSKNQASTASYADDVMRGHFARECRAPKNQGNRNRDASTRNAPAEEELTNFALMAYTSQGSSSLSNSDSEVHTCSKECLKSYETLQKQYDQQRKALNKSNLKIIDKTGLGYDSQINESDLNDIHVKDSEVLNNMIDSHESDGDDNQVNDRFKKDEGYHTVPPPYTENYMPPRVDLSFAGLDNYVFKSKVSKTITSVPKIKTNVSKTSKDSFEKPKTVRPSAPLIKEWELDSKDENVFEPKEVEKIVKPSLEKIEFVHARNTTVENENKAEEPKKSSQSPRVKKEIGMV